MLLLESHKGFTFELDNGVSYQFGGEEHFTPCLIKNKDGVICNLDTAKGVSETVFIDLIINI